MTSQKEYLLRYMQQHDRVSIVDLTKLGIYRYSARMHELRKDGYEFEKKEKTVKHPRFKNQRHVWYRLKSNLSST